MNRAFLLAFTAMVLPALTPAQRVPTLGASPAARQDAPSQDQSQAPFQLHKLSNGNTLLQFDPNGNFIITWPACPVDMEARQTMDGDLLKVRREAPDAPHTHSMPGQNIYVIVRNTGVVSATVKVGGLSARTRFSRSEAGAGPADIWRTLQIAFTPEKDGSVSAILKLPGFTSVKSIRLISVTYADGSTWTVPQRSQCTVQPNPLMRIAER